MRLSSGWYFALLALLACSAAACGVTDVDQAAYDPGPGVSGPNASLSFELDGTLTLAPGELATVRVKGSPAAHYEVSFFLLGDALDASLDQTKVVADEQGAASVQLRAPNSSTTFRLRAAIKDGPSVETAIAVSDKGFGTIHVVPVYEGKRDVTQWVASVVARTTCADIVKSLPADPEGAIVAKANAHEDPIVEDAPVGPSLAVAVRSGHSMWGCADAVGLVAGGTSTVKVQIVEKPIDLPATDLAVSLAWVPEGEPYEALMTEAGMTLANKVFPPGEWPWTTMLDAMGATLGADDAIDFEAARASLSWDAAVELQLAGVDPRASIAAWAAQGVASEVPWIDSRLTAIGDSPGHALLEVLSFAGASPEAAGVPSKHLVAWTADATDNVLLAGPLYWVPSRYAATLALAGAQVDFPGVDSVPEALGQLTDCAGLAASLGAAGECYEACLRVACETALASLWNGGLDAGGPVGQVSITAGGQAEVGDTANPISFSGTWIGKITLGMITVPINGPASGAPYANPPQ